MTSAINQREPDGQATIVWVATGFDIHDGGRSWIQVTTAEQAAKDLCQERYDHEREAIRESPEPLTWKPSLTAARVFGQESCVAGNNRTGKYYEVRKVEVKR